jgi:transposase-like protein
MEKVGNSLNDLSLFEFQKKFSSDDDCLKHLASVKWESGYVCKKCNHTHSCKGVKEFDKQCTKCNYVESPMAGTLFHKIKFPLLNAFYMVYFISTNKKGITSTELARKLGMKQKVCWLFKRKVMIATDSSGNFPLSGVVEVDETFVGGSDENSKGRKKGKKKLVVVAIEKQKKGVSRFYAKVIDKADAASLGSFMEQKITKEAKILTDEWTGYKPLDKIFPNMTHIKSGKKGENFPEMHRVIMNFKGWLRGMHHHVGDLQDYINEYTYRFNRSFMKGNIFDNLLERMIKTKPHSYKMIIN